MRGTVTNCKLYDKLLRCRYLAENWGHLKRELSPTDRAQVFMFLE